MITAVDTNVLIDILEPDPVFGPASRDALKRCRLEGAIVACSVVWAELGAVYGVTFDVLLQTLDSIGLEYVSIERESATAAAQMWHQFRRQNTRRERIAADFLIGGFATVKCDRLLTRDRGFYRGLFKDLVTLDPRGE